MLLHYGGHYAGSDWVYFGVDNVDLFADSHGAAAQLLQQAVRFLAGKTFLRNLQTNHGALSPGRVRAGERGGGQPRRADQSVQVALEWEPSPALPHPVRVDLVKTVAQGSSAAVRGRSGDPAWASGDRADAGAACRSAMSRG